MNTQLVASVIISGLLKPLILLVIIGVLAGLLRKKSASLQHFVLSLGVIGLLVFTLLAFGLADSKFAFFPTVTELIQIPGAWLTAINQWLSDYTSARNFLLVAGIYLLPASFLVFYLLVGIVCLWLQTRAAKIVQNPQITNQLTELCQLIDIQRPIKVVVSCEIDSPQTWGVFRPVIMLPPEALLWDQDKQLSVLIHELGHIARWDWLTTLLIKCTCACFWFLLPIWWIANQIYQQAEIACDDYIFKLRDKHLVYAQNLLAIAGSEKSAPENESLHMRGQSPVYQRIMALLDKQRPHQPVAMEAAQYWVICSGLVLAFYASVQLIPLEEQLRNNKDFWLTIIFPEIDQPPAPVKEKTIVIENFSWELLQQLKPEISQQPELLNDLEETRVRVTKPEKSELYGNVSVPAIAPEIPDIQVMGYLPLDLVTPEYPPIALQKGIEGWVQVEFSIDIDGKIVEPRIIGHAPSAVFDRPVLNALLKSRYRPQLLNGQPVVMRGVTETFRFELAPAEPHRRR